jgi:hypothetical protein
MSLTADTTIPINCGAVRKGSVPSFEKEKEGESLHPLPFYEFIEKGPATHSTIISGNRVETPAPYPQHYMSACHKEKFFKQFYYSILRSKKQGFFEILKLI